MNTQFRAPVDPFSEYAMVLESDEYPKTDFTQFQFHGEVDVEALAESYTEALKLVPTFSCQFREERTGLRYQPYWVLDPNRENRLQVEDCRHMAGDEFEPMEFSTRFHAHRTIRRIDLSCEFPVRCFLVRVADDRYIFSMLYHHSVMDPGKAYPMLTAMLAGYHKRVTGEEPYWKNAVGSNALAGARQVAHTEPFMKFAKEQLSDIFGNRGINHIASSPNRNERGRHSVRQVIEDHNLLGSLLQRTKRSNVTLNDLLMAVARRTITQWNHNRGSEADKLRMMLVTSLRGRAQLSQHGGAGVSGLNFLLNGDTPENLDAVAQYVRDRRINQLNRGIDVSYYNFVTSVIGKSRFMPLDMRRKLIRPIMESVPCTFYISNVGIIWPEIKNGKVTGDTALRGAGKFVIDDMHSSASIMRNLGLGLTVRTHNRRFYLNFVADRSRFTSQEIGELTNRYMDNLEQAA